MAPLDPQHIAVLQSASPGAIATAMARVVGYAASGRWLGTRNRYRIETVAKLRLDTPPAGTMRPSQLADYMAAAAPLHCCDGWAFLGRALASHLHGDNDTARHLAYYAELRAATSLLSAQGVGIFRNRHFVINSAGGASILGPRQPTHQAAWATLEAWAGLPSASNLLGIVLEPGGRPIRDWIDGLPGGAAWQPIARTWLLRMGLDLAQLSGDRDARNEASYRPTRLSPRSTVEPSQAAAYVRELWSLLEPAPPLAFDRLDRHLLRLTLETAHRSVTNRSHRQTPAAFRAAIDATTQVNAPQPMVALWRDFLVRDGDPEDPRLLELSLRETVATKPRHHEGVIARALLLLRVASGAVRRLFLDAGVDLDGLAFWWHSYGAERGLWDAPPDGRDVADTWADAEDALAELEAWGANPDPSTYRELLAACPRALIHLTAMEMVALWSLAS